MAKSVKDIRTRNLNSPRPGTEIKVLLLRANLTQTQLAESLAVPVTTLDMNIHGHRQNRRLQQRIAGRLVERLPVHGTRLTWNPVSSPAGVYFLKLNADTHSSTTKLLKLE